MRPKCISLYVGLMALTAACTPPNASSSTVYTVPSRLGDLPHPAVAEKFARLSSVAYLPTAIEMRARLTGSLPGFAFDFVEVGDVKVVIAWDDADVAIAFRGTHPDDYSILAQNMGRNVATLRTEIPNSPSGARFHSGFAGGVDSILSDLRLKLLAVGVTDKTLWVSGHSLGGAMAQIAAVRLASLPGHTIGGVYTFGSPAPGNAAAQAHIGNRVQVLRYFHPSDPIPRLPPRCLGFSRAASEINIATMQRETGLPLFDIVPLPVSVSFPAHSLDSSYAPALRQANLQLTETSEGDASEALVEAPKVAGTPSTGDSDQNVFAEEEGCDVQGDAEVAN